MPADRHTSPKSERPQGAPEVITQEEIAEYARLEGDFSRLRARLVERISAGMRVEPGWWTVRLCGSEVEYELYPPF
jgi:hypothetical protein